MLVKYYGLTEDNGEGKPSPRTKFLLDGLFRITQPVFLNDKGSESKLYPYFNEFSPSDLAWAKRKAIEEQGIQELNLSDEELERFFLRPMGMRYGEAFPHLLRLDENFSTMDEYDEAELRKAVSVINHTLIQALSCQIGVFSLAKSNLNELMWTHYASEGKGIALSFKEDHEFFRCNPPKSVDYRPEGRASITYYKGTLRINGEPVESFQVSDIEDPFKVIFECFSKGIDFQDMTERLFYSKEKKWSYEDEARIIFSLSSADQTLGERFEMNLDSKVKDKLSNLLKSPQEICLKRIPFDAFESLSFGYDIDESVKEEIIRIVESNPELQHLELKQIKHDIYGELNAESVSVTV